MSYRSTARALARSCWSAVIRGLQLIVTLAGKFRTGLRLHGLFFIARAKAVLHWAYLLTGCKLKVAAITAWVMAPPHSTIPIAAGASVVKSVPVATAAAPIDSHVMIVHEVAFIVYVVLMVITLLLKRK